jgi:hypothetical protein
VETVAKKKAKEDEGKPLHTRISGPRSDENRKLFFVVW